MQRLPKSCYKRRFCKYGDKCRYGNRCTFAHSPAELCDAPNRPPRHQLEHGQELLSTDLYCSRSLNQIDMNRSNFSTQSSMPSPLQTLQRVPQLLLTNSSPLSGNSAAEFRPLYAAGQFARGQEELRTNPCCSRSLNQIEMNQSNFSTQSIMLSPSQTFQHVPQLLCLTDSSPLNGSSAEFMPLYSAARVGQAAHEQEELLTNAYCSRSRNHFEMNQSNFSTQSSMPSRLQTFQRVPQLLLTDWSPLNGISTAEFRPPPLYSAAAAQVAHEQEEQHTNPYCLRSLNRFEMNQSNFSTQSSMPSPLLSNTTLEPFQRVIQRPAPPTTSTVETGVSLAAHAFPPPAYPESSDDIIPVSAPGRPAYKPIDY